MFPHTGGLSTDVNRQVRANQNLIVSFFRSCMQLSSSASSSASSSTASGSSAKRKKKDKEFLNVGGKIIVTLFESEPYTLWNIRDLARHVGLKVVESFKFDSGDYPGYKHVRTLGHIEGGGAWKAEDRSARMYVFEKVEREPEDGEDEDGGGKTKKGKRKDASGRGKKRERDDSGTEED
jgi:25S rRNA (uracil2634-N3)-methyltransferase